MAERKDYDSISILEIGGSTVLDLGTMEIWDGADLSLLRDSLGKLTASRCPAIGVDMSHVKYVPSGFFGMLYESYEKGAEIRLFDPQARVRNMLWFRKFFEMEPSGSYRLIGAELPARRSVGSRVRVAG